MAYSRTFYVCVLKLQNYLFIFITSHLFLYFRCYCFHRYRYFSELTEYGWDQSDKFVKLFITLGGVQNLDESAVETKFTDRSLNVHVTNLHGKDYGLVINNLLEPIDVVKSYRKIKTGMIAIYLKKVNEGRHWSCLTSIHKRLKDQQDSEMKSTADSDNPSDALVNIMKKMYQTGDSKTKQMIAKAWTESQEKIHRGDASTLDLPSM